MNLKQLEYFVQEPGSFSKAAVVLLIDNPTHLFKFQRRANIGIR